MSDISDAIAANAAGPKKVVSDGVSVEQHPIQDQIAADKYVEGQTAASRKHRGIRFTKLISPGPM